MVALFARRDRETVHHQENARAILRREVNFLLTPGCLLRRSGKTFLSTSSRRIFTPFAMLRFLPLLCLSAFCFSPSARSASPPKPNIVYILADDLGIGDVACYGGDLCAIETPHIDALAENGIRFTDAYVAASVCIPSRIAMMTGRYPWRFGPPEKGGAWGFLGLQFPTDTFTLGDLLESAGYTTGYVGKWHLGTRMKTFEGQTQDIGTVDYTHPLLTGPNDFGFSETFILPGSLDMYPYAYVRNHEWQGEVTATKGWSAFNRQGPAEEDFEDHEVLETFYRESEAFLAKQSPEAPFFLFLGLTAPHTPTSPGTAWQGKSRIGIYGDFVMEVDHAVARVVAALEKANLAENTLVLFASDHGPASYAGRNPLAIAGQMDELKKEGHHANGPYRGYKFTVFEGGQRVPLLAKWPSGIKEPGRTSESLVSLTDLMATFAEVSGSRLSEAQAPDSFSFAPVFTDPGALTERESVVMQGGGNFVIRRGQWKLCLNPGSGAPGKWGNTPPEPEAWAAAIREFGRVPAPDETAQAPFLQLYDLEADPAESTNLAGKHPEIVAELIERLGGIIESGRSRPGPALKNDRERIPFLPRVPRDLKQG